ncbi:MAG: PLP-dependent aminotransferase family protein [Lachnospiraceae bacterium]|nr:PLP-dependent aminotransferase family protein [Lachnospiraceae bacterium]
MFYFERESKSPLYQQLYEQLRQQITEGLFPKGSKLPPTRELAAEYHLSRNTVIQAYQQLEIEGYIRGTVGSGYYVEDLSLFPCSYCRTQPKEPLFPKAEKGEMLYDFYYGNLDYNCYQSKAWRRCLLDACDWMAAQKTVAYSEPEGLPALRHELAGYLHVSRGVRCLADQIILTGGHQHSLSVLARLFSGENWKFAMEEPGYNGTRIVMQQYGFSPVSVPLEQDGISVAKAERLSHALLYITPSHQFPMGSVLPIAKRLELLQWAAKSDSYILEDDYDSELRYHSLPIPSLQSIDGNERTIYMGTFSKSLSPDLRIAYLILPRPLLGIYHTIFSHANCSVPSLLQYALAQFFHSGEYQKHINAMRTHYQKKHDYILNYFKENLWDRAILSGADAGLHFIMTLQNGFGNAALTEEFEKNKLRIYSLSPFWNHQSSCPVNQFLLGYGSIPLVELPLAVSAVRAAIEQLDRNDAPLR